MSESPKKNLQCGSCSYLIRDRVFEARCSELGRIPTSRACGSHAPDVFTLVNSEERIENLQKISELMAQLGTTDLQILGSLCLNEKNTRKNGFKFRQKVYVRIRGSSNANYMSNFVVGYVLDASRDTVRVIGESGAIAISAINDKNSETVYVAARFNSIRADMVANKKYVDPSLETEQEKLSRKSYGTILTIDAAAEEGILDKKALKKQKVKDDLVSLVARLGRGQLKAKKKSGEGGDRNAEIKIDWNA